MTETFEKHLSVLIIKKKESWFSIFIQKERLFSFRKKDYSRGGIKSHPGFKH